MRRAGLTAEEAETYFSRTLHETPPTTEEKRVLATKRLLAQVSLAESLLDVQSVGFRGSYNAAWIDDVRIVDRSHPEAIVDHFDGHRMALRTFLFFWPLAILGIATLRYGLPMSCTPAGRDRRLFIAATASLMAASVLGMIGIHLSA